MRKLEGKEVHSLLRLMSVPGFGSYRIRRLIAHFKSPSTVFDSDIRSLTKIEGIDKTLAQNILVNSDPRFADAQIESCQKENVQILTFYDENYPSNLREIPDPPIVLFMQGGLLLDDVISIGVVGTRIPSDYGRRTAERLTRELSNSGFSIISGLARGIDTIVHHTCVKYGSRTIAVLGSGLDIIYPGENKKLAKSIIENGALISELPCGSQPDAVNFPKRNRIISGMSLGVLVVEAGEKSGALITADSALNQNREIFSIPGNIHNVKSLGTNRLIKEGAKLVQTVDDIIEELENKLRVFSLEKSQTKAIPKDLSDKEKRIVELLSVEPIHIDHIAQATGFSISEVLSILLTLELKDIVKQYSGKMFSLV